MGADLTSQHGIGRGTFYMLKVVREAPGQEAQPADEEKILAYVREKGSINNEACRELLTIGENQAWYLLRKLTDAGALKRQGEGRWRRYMLP